MDVLPLVPGWVLRTDSLLEHVSGPEDGGHGRHEPHSMTPRMAIETRISNQGQAFRPPASVLPFVWCPPLVPS